MCPPLPAPLCEAQAPHPGSGADGARRGGSVAQRPSGVLVCWQAASLSRSQVGLHAFHLGPAVLNSAVLCWTMPRSGEAHRVVMRLHCTVRYAFISVALMCAALLCTMHAGTGLPLPAL
jgi:hypothetical protein